MTQALQWYRSLSWDHKAGLFVWPSLRGSALETVEEALLAQYRPSGIVLFKRNLATPVSAYFLTLALRKILGVTAWKTRGVLPFLAIDEEGGRVSRLPYPDARGLSALQLSADVSALTAHVQRQIRYSRLLGINCLLAPVADILTEPHNPVMGDRCFGRTAEEVSRGAVLVHELLQNAGLFSCAKHFPGHGNTLEDSHLAFARSAAPLPLLRLREWIPFRRLIQGGIPFVMTAHVLVPAVDPHRPATLSPLALQSVLRGELGFQGLVLSDDMRMNAIKHFYRGAVSAPTGVVEADICERQGGPGAVAGGAETGDDDKAVVRGAQDALLAGCDIVLCCQGIQREEVVLRGIAQRLQHDPHFAFVCEQKVQRIVNTAQQIVTSP